MHILVSNDDGCKSPGLEILAESLARIADVTVVVPDQDRSTASNSLTLTRPLRVIELQKNFYAVNGTPTDCVHIAVTGLLRDDPPDMVIAGINHGENLGDDVLYSGTVAAAMEGRFLGLPALAVSAVGTTRQCLRLAAEVTNRIVTRLQHVALASDMILNVNVPDCEAETLRGMQGTRLGNRHPAKPVIRAHDPRGNTIYWIGAPGSEHDAGAGTDFHAIAQRMVSVTPLHSDLTKHRSIAAIRQWLNDFAPPD